MSETSTHIEKKKMNAEQEKAQLSKKRSMVPELRFKEFDGEWESSYFETFLKEKNSLAYGVLQPGKDVEGGVPMLRTVDLNDHGLKSGTVLLKIPKELDEQYKRTRLKGGELIISVMGTLGRTIIVPSEWVGWNVNRALAVAKLNSSIDKWFLIQILRSPKFEKKVIEEALGSAQKRINLGDLKEYKFTLPSLPEQQKIASFLSAIDEKIQLLSRKKEMLEDYKKGVMQQIFSQQIRFRDENGNAFPEWEEKTLGQLATRVKQKNSDNAENYVLTNSATQGIVSQQDYFDKNIANQSNLEGYYVVDVNDFVYNPRISVHAPVGPIKRNKLQKGVMSPLYSVFRFKNDDLDYLELFFETTLWHRYLNSVANFGARHDRMNITNDDFYKMPIPFPCEKERKMISNYLKSISDKLERTKEQLTQIQAYKRGLLQKMFV